MRHLKIVNIVLNGRRTSITLSEVQLKIAQKLASEHHGVNLNEYLCTLIEAVKSQTPCGASTAVRDGILIDLYNIWRNR